MTKIALLKSWVILPASDIHGRTAAGVVSKLRKQTMALAVTAMLEKPTPKSVVIHQYSQNAKRDIRLAVGKEIINKAGQKVYRVILWITHVVITACGELKKIRHKFQIAFPVTASAGVLPA